MLDIGRRISSHYALPLFIKVYLFAFSHRQYIFSRHHRHRADRIFFLCPDSFRMVLAYLY
jgi:hypothetical protein